MTDTDSPRWMVGDPDPTPKFVNSYCSQQGPDNHDCTWPEGHPEPFHVAGDGSEVLAVWQDVAN